MSSTEHLDSNDIQVPGPVQVAAALTRARTRFREDAGGTLAVAIRCHEQAISLGEASLSARALALEGQVALHRGDMRSGLALALEAERLLAAGGDDTAQAEVAALRAHVSFFTGAYSHALDQRRARDRVRGRQRRPRSAHLRPPGGVPRVRQRQRA